MNLPMLDKGSRVPLYIQLSEWLIRKIQSEKLKPGDQLPSERELADLLNVSRITARQGIEALLDKGLIYREQGRGTFVAKPQMRGIQSFTSFTQDMLSRGMKPTSKILVQEVIQVDDEELKFALKLEPDEQAIHLERLRLADDEPVALQISYIPYKLCPGLEDFDLADRSLFATLRERFYVYPSWTEAEIKADSATEDIASLLDIEPGDPILVVRGLTFTDTFETVESVSTIYRGKGLALYMGRQRLEKHEG